MIADPVRDSALRLLRAMNDLYAKGRTEVNVGLEPDVLDRAGLSLDSALLDPAMEWLLREGALRRNDELDAVATGVLEARSYGIHFNITERGFDLLNIHPNV
jgi:hypothetical protein